MGTVASLLSGETAKIQILHRGHPTVNGSLKEKGSRQCVTSSLGPFLRVSFNTHRYPEPTTMVASVSYGASGPDGPRAWVPLRVEPYASLDVGLFNSPFTWVGKALHVGGALVHQQSTLERDVNYSVAKTCKMAKPTPLHVKPPEQSSKCRERFPKKRAGLLRSGASTLQLSSWEGLPKVSRRRHGSLPAHSVRTSPRLASKISAT